MKTETTLAALLLAAIVFLTALYSTRVNGKHFRIQSMQNGVSRHDCELILGEPKSFLPETGDLRAAYVYELGNDWRLMIYFENYGLYVHSFGIHRAVLAAVDRPTFVSN